LRLHFCFFFQAEDGIRDFHVTGVQTCALPIFVIDPRVKGVVNIISARPVPRGLVYPTLLSALRLAGYAAVEADGVVKIVPEADRSEERRVGKEGRSRWSA